MDIDDTDDKARRNVVVASSLVLLCATVGAPLPLVAERLLDITLAPTPHLLAWRVWIAVLAILVYLGLRYRFSPATAEALLQAPWVSDWYSAATGRTKAAIARKVKVFSESGKLAPGIDVELVRKAAEHSKGQTGAVCRKVSISDFEFTNPWSGSFSVLVEWAHVKSLGGSRVVFDLRGRHRWRPLAEAVTLFAIYSETSIQFAAPVLMFAAAVLFTAFKLVSS